VRTVGSAFISAKNSQLVKPIYLYTLRYDPVGNKFKRWTSWPLGVIFDGDVYEFFSITHNGISEDSSGAIQKATVKALNISREIQTIIDDNDGLRERELTITQVFEDTLSDPSAYISDSFVIADVTVTEREAIFSLSSNLDVFDVKIPRTQISRAFCRFKFKGSECGYAGSESQCNKTLQRCRELNNSKRFGAFPATPIQNIFLGDTKT